MTLIVALRQSPIGSPLSIDRHGAHVLFAICAALFVSAALVAALTNAPQRAALIDPTSLRKLAPDLWNEPVDRVKKMVFSSQLIYLDQAQRGNDRRGRLLFSAMLLLALAVIALALTVTVATL